MDSRLKPLDVHLILGPQSFPKRVVVFQLFIMSAPTIEHETQILNKYVDHEKLKAKLLEKCGPDFDIKENIEVCQTRGRS